ncbi:GtrA family protein [Actinoplanes sp. TFC3]|uniref:GtrA family protein n=1 Tax=Actinoplanes sp. TFC3 TaxID=1710355 RepID=UPI0008326BB3|nr:GtrA family protein [Actinoplanes sp. TFC3]
MFRRRHEAVNYALKLTALHEKPVTALVFATVVSTILSYVLNREWSFRHRFWAPDRHVFPRRRRRRQ